jgi:hypothetical protein
LGFVDRREQLIRAGIQFVCQSNYKRLREPHAAGSKENRRNRLIKPGFLKWAAYRHLPITVKTKAEGISIAAIKLFIELDASETFAAPFRSS